MPRIVGHGRDSYLSRSETWHVHWAQTKRPGDVFRPEKANRPALIDELDRTVTDMERLAEVG
jgi:hypothetical protein